MDVATVFAVVAVVAVIFDVNVINVVNFVDAVDFVDVATTAFVERGSYYHFINITRKKYNLVLLNLFVPFDNESC